MIKQSSRLYAKNWEAVRTGENLLNQEVDKETYREIYLTDRRFNMISRAKKYVAVLLFFVCVCMIFSPLTAYAAEDSSQYETVKVGFFAMDGYHMMDEVISRRKGKIRYPVILPYRYAKHNTYKAVSIQIIGTIMCGMVKEF